MKKLKMITESNFQIQVNETQDKEYYLEGTFAVAEKRNQNNRIYKKDILKNQIDKYIEEKVKTRQSLGECNHPTDRSEVDITKAAILIEDLQWKEDNTTWGKAKVLEGTPYGDIIRGLLKNGCSIGISSRGLGTVNEDNYVNDDYNLITFDLVHLPSAPGAFLQGILEGIEFDTPTNTKTYTDVKSLMNENSYIKKIDPLKIKEWLDEGYTPEMIKDYIDNKMEEHYKKIWQILESI